MRSIIGQYIPTESVLHRLDPRIKVAATIVYIVLAFLIQSAVGYVLLTLFLITMMGLSRIKPTVILRSVKPILFVVAFTFVLNLFFVAQGTPIFEWWILRITDEAVVTALRIAYRLIILIMGTSMLTLTTTNVDLTDAMEKLMSPLRVIRFPVHELAMMMTIALRFIPTLMEETDRIMKAQRARGADFDEGGAIKRARALIPLLIPLFVSAFRIASDLAVAMEARCYHGGKDRTRMKVLRLQRRDYIAIAVLTLLTAIIIADACGAFAAVDALLRSVVGGIW